MSIAFYAIMIDSRRLRIKCGLSVAVLTGLSLCLMACNHAQSPTLVSPSIPSRDKPEADLFANQIEQQNDADFRKSIAGPIQFSQTVRTELERLLSADQAFHARYLALHDEIARSMTGNKDEVQKAVEQLKNEFDGIDASHTQWTLTRDKMQEAQAVMNDAKKARLQQCERGPTPAQLSNVSNLDYVRAKMIELCHEHTHELLDLPNCATGGSGNAELCRASQSLRDAQASYRGTKDFRNQVEQERHELRNQYFALSRRLNLLQNP